MQASPGIEPGPAWQGGGVSWPKANYTSGPMNFEVFLSALHWQGIEEVMTSKGRSNSLLLAVEDAMARKAG